MTVVENINSFLYSNIIAVVIVIAVIAAAVVIFMREKTKLLIKVQNDRMRNIELEGAKYRVAAEISNDILFEYDIVRDIMTMASKYCEIYGRSNIIEEYSRNCGGADYIHEEDRSVYAHFVDDLVSGKELIESEFRMKGAEGEYIWGHLRGKTIYDDKDEPIKVIGKIVNIDLQKRELIKLNSMAKLDPYTGVYNKSAFADIVGKALKLPEGSSGRYAFAVIDVDNFKNFNDRYGHLFGDRVLKEVIDIVKNVFKGDVIGRVGGDEFSVLINASGRSEVEEKLKKFMKAIRDSHNVDDREVKVTVSMGVALACEGIDYTELFKSADLALYDVKNAGKNNYRIA